MNARTFLPLALLLAGCPTTGDDDDDAVGSDYGETIAAALWADDMTVTLDGDTLTLADDGVPDHAVLEAYGLMDGSTVGVLAYDYSMEIPMNPVMADEPTDTSLGTIGVAISGGVYFNPYEGDGTTVAVDNNFDVDGIPFLDTCNAHPLPSGTDFHYHGVPYCITDEVDAAGEHSVIIGVLLDGFAVYGPQDVDGEAPTDLDECSGHEGPTPEFPDGVYHYHLTETAPYSIDCYAGEVDVADMGGPPGGGGPGGGGPPN
ncbi:MAG: YHYH protein [Deltaproteobacteria bacterium]|nr:YHYH protein [Deltaproteobacteria bacterium]